MEWTRTWIISISCRVWGVEKINGTRCTCGDYLGGRIHERFRANNQTFQQEFQTPTWCREEHTGFRAQGLEPDAFQIQNVP